MSDSSDSGRVNDQWPIELEGVTETVVTTRGPNGRWNAAALGVFAPGVDSVSRVTARTWGQTRTRRNFHRTGHGFVQFVRDPEAFVEAALTIYELDSPVLECAAAWTNVSVESNAVGVRNGTEWEQWTLEPIETTIERRFVPTIDRGFAAVIEATIDASRLGVTGYDDEQLRERLDHYESIIERTGGTRDRAAMQRIRDVSET